MTLIMFAQKFNVLPWSFKLKTTHQIADWENLYKVNLKKKKK